MPYGFTSRLRLWGGASSPTSVPYIETRKVPSAPPAPTERGSARRKIHSLRRMTERRIWIPHICSRPGRYRSDLNGMAISIAHPPSKRAERVSQTGFQSMLGFPSFVIWKSEKPPIAVPLKAKAFRRS